MLNNITLGQYFPGTSFVHKLDPRTKLLATLLFIVAIFVAVSRIYFVVHYPTDVLVGVIVGIIAGSIATLIAKKLPKICYEIDFLHLKKGKHEIT